jgi:hypothetical protein
MDGGRRELELYASHHQFYVADGVYAGDDPVFWAGAGVEDFQLWDGTALERHLAVQPGIVAIGTVAHGVVPVTVDVGAAPPAADLEAWDHVVEASLEVPSGRLVLGSVDGWEPATGEIVVAPASYRVRVSGAGLDRAHEHGEGDRYCVQLWPSGVLDPVVVKWWSAWDPAGVRPAPTGAGGRLLVGAEADDARVPMHWLASRGDAHLFVDGGGVLWEHTNLRDATGTPQLEELPEEEAERRYGPRGAWRGGALDASARGALRALWQSLRRRGSG